MCADIVLLMLGVVMLWTAIVAVLTPRGDHKSLYRSQVAETPDEDPREDNDG